MTKLISLLFIASSLDFFAVEIPVTFDIDTEESVVRYDLSLTQFGTDSDTSNISGTLDALLTIEPDTGRLEGLELTGGLVTFSPVEFDFSFNVATIDVDFSSMTAVPESPEGIEILANDDGILSASAHFLEFTSGTVTMVVRAPGVNDRTVIDVTEPTQNEGVDPDSLAALDDLKVTLVEVSRSQSEILWEATFRGTGRISDTQTQDGISVTLTSTASLQAQTIFKTPTNFGNWLIEQDLNMTTQSETPSSKGVPFGLLHAFDLSKDDEALPFFAMNQADGNPAVMIDCPEGGLRREISINRSTTLDPALATDGLGSLPLGTTGLQEIPFPTGPKNFAWLSTQ